MPSLHRRPSGASDPTSAPEAPIVTWEIEDGRIVRREGALPSIAEEAARHGLLLHLLAAPSREQIQALAESWSLHPLLEEDLVKAHQRPKLERYGDVLFVVARSALYVDDREEVELAEFHVLARPGEVVLLCQDGRWIDGRPAVAFTEALVEREPERLEILDDASLLRWGAEAVVYRLLDAIVDGFRPVLEGLTTDREEIERQVFTGDPSVAERIYRLSREVIDVQQAVSSLVEVLESLRGGFERHAVNEEPAGLPPGRLRPPHPGRVPRHRTARRARTDPVRERHARGAATELRDAEDLRLGRHRTGTHPGGRHLRDELRLHAGTALGLRLSARAMPHGGTVRDALRGVQEAQVDVAVRAVRPSSH
ncbi:CorA family divalent cation transporter [Demequina litorisediminis]|uniref:Magnesium transporter n=1 Tax=Demequina litorisediminis TaxID=1849022 RepID=A0ABQ6IEM4_9MICO|nr:hypothetical protein GCM10025876_17670 [Demequina litorisediminis]